MDENVLATKENKENIKFSGKYYQGVGRRKRAIARVRLYPGKGLIFINNHLQKNNQDLSSLLELCAVNNKFDLSININGGGITSRFEAIRHGIARALQNFDKNLTPTLRKAGYLTRDPREKERKKPGLKRARRAPQWQKR